MSASLSNIKGTFPEKLPWEQKILEFLKLIFFALCSQLLRTLGKPKSEVLIKLNSVWPENILIAKKFQNSMFVFLSLTHKTLGGFSKLDSTCPELFRQLSSEKNTLLDIFGLVAETFSLLLKAFLAKLSNLDSTCPEHCLWFFFGEKTTLLKIFRIFAKNFCPCLENFLAELSKLDFTCPERSRCFFWRKNNFIKKFSELVRKVLVLSGKLVRRSCQNWIQRV